MGYDAFYKRLRYKYQEFNPEKPNIYIVIHLRYEKTPYYLFNIFARLIMLYN